MAMKLNIEPEKLSEITDALRHIAAFVDADGDLIVVCDRCDTRLYAPEEEILVDDPEYAGEFSGVQLLLWAANHAGQPCMDFFLTGVTVDQLAAEGGIELPE